MARAMQQSEGRSAPMDNGSPDSRARATVAATAAWQITGLCGEIHALAKKIPFLDADGPHPPHQVALIIETLAARAYKLAVAAQVAVEGDDVGERVTSLRELEKAVSREIANA